MKKSNLFTNKKVGIIILTLLLGLAISMTLLFAHTSSINSVYASSNFSTEEIVLDQATINDDFAPDAVSVVLTRQVSRQLRIYTIYDFEELNLISVKHVTADMEAWLHTLHVDEREIELETFRKSLLLTLYEPGKENVLMAVQLLQNRNDVYMASPDFYIEFEEPGTVENLDNFQPMSTTTNWALQRIGMQQARSITTGQAQVTVGVIDSGIDRNHPYLNSLIHTNETLHRCFAGTNDPFRVSSTFPGNHGTQVAGAVAAANNNNIGVARNIRLVSLRVSGMSGRWHEVEAAVRHAHIHRIPIINISIGERAVHAGTRDALLNFNGLAVIAAGNDNRAPAMFPATLSAETNHIISVGSSNNADARAGHSAHGAETVCLFAPGEDIYTATVRYRNWPWQSWRYTTAVPGTSYAAPLVAGTAALLLSVDSSLGATAKRNIIKDSATRLNAFNGISRSGGRLNALEALRQVFPFETRQVSGGIEIARASGILTGSVNIPAQKGNQNIVSIGPSAFANQNSVMDITVPSTVTSIGRNAFSASTVVEWEGHYRFRGNVFLELLRPTASFTIPTSIAGRAIVEIGPYAFAGGRERLSVTIPSSVLRIGANALYGREVWLTADRTVIEDGLFEGTGLSRIDLSRVRYIGVRAFFQERQLRHISIPGSVRYIGAGAFWGSGLQSISFSDGNPLVIGAHAFADTASLGFVTLPGRIESIGPGAFFNSRIEEVNILQGARNVSIGEWAFALSAHLRIVNIPINVTHIEWGAFLGSNNLTINAEALSRPSGWNESWNIDNRPVRWGLVEANNMFFRLRGNIAVLYGYRENNHLRTFSIPQSVVFDGVARPVTTISSEFRGSENIALVAIPSAVTHIESGAFEDVGRIFGINWQFRSPLVSGQDIIRPLVTIVRIPPELTVIPNNAFDGFFRLRTVIGLCRSDDARSPLDVNLTRIGAYAFRGTAINHVGSISYTVTGIGRYAFADTPLWNNTPNNSVVYVGHQVPNAWVVGMWAVGVRGQLSGDYTMRTMTRGIADRAFSQQPNLTSITLPMSVRYVGLDSFWRTTLEHMTILVRNQWHPIFFGIRVFVNNPPKRIYVSMNDWIQVYHALPEAYRDTIVTR